jgi:hypothetical protein
MPSLTLSEKDGRVLVHCFSGCGQSAVLEALAARTLWPERPGGLTVDKIATAKGLPVLFLRDLGVRDGVALEGRERVECVDIPYLDTAGQEVAVRKRLRLAGEPRFKWRRGDKLALYGLWRLGAAQACDYVLLVEGESDCWVCWHAGIAALGIPGASTWRADWAQLLQTVGTVAVWREADAGGETLASKVAASLPDVRIIEAPLEAKDPSARGRLSPTHARPWPGRAAGV